jgi:hypothetical protein
MTRPFSGKFDKADVEDIRFDRLTARRSQLPVIPATFAPFSAILRAVAIKFLTLNVLKTCRQVMPNMRLR